jgi:hypothetical protein
VLRSVIREARKIVLQDYQYSATALAALLVSLILAGCGGGGGSDSGGLISTAAAAEVVDVSGATSLDPTLQGTWISATAGHVSGSACGVDARNQLEIRFTFTFSGNSYLAKAEKCALAQSGNIGTFVQFDLMDGTHSTGAGFLNSENRQYSMLDLHYFDSARRSITVYLGYNIAGPELRLTRTLDAADGSTPSRRESGTGPFQLVYLKQ